MSSIRAALTVLVISTLVVGAGLTLSFHSSGRAIADLGAWAPLIIALLAFSCEYVDSTLGMGYGTTMTPLLLFAGFAPLAIVPVILLSELVTGFLAAAMHHRAGNVDFKRGGLDLRVALVLGAVSVAGALVAVFVAISISKTILTAYIGALVLSMGVIILALRGREGRFSWKRIVGLGLLASFNKGVSGGGYGPVVTCGQILSGVTGKRAVGITSLAEALTCAAGLAAYFITRGAPDLGLALPLVVGAVCSVPFSVLSVRRIEARWLNLVVGVVTVVLGAAVLIGVASSVQVGL
jgi:hypothetical protein